MSYINEAFKRMDLEQIQSFLLYGTDSFSKCKEPYGERLKNGSDPIYNRLKSIYSDGSDLDAATADLAEALTTYEIVHMEIGMKAGARLIYQLLVTNDYSMSEVKEK